MSAPVGDLVGSLVLSADQRELIYAHQVGAGPWNYRRSVRASTNDSFPVGTVLPELDAACAVNDVRTLDLSLDGLRAYLHCEPDLTGRARPPHLALWRRSLLRLRAS